MAGRNMKPVLWATLLSGWSTSAFAYPGGTAVSTGSNPVSSYGGEILGSYSSDLPVPSVIVLSATADQDFVVTDVNLMPRFSSVGCRAMVGVELSGTGGVGTLAHYHLAWEVAVTSNNISAPGGVDSHLNSGLRVPAGTSLEMTVTPNYIWGCGAWGVTYTLSGYHATP